MISQSELIWATPAEDQTAFYPFAAMQMTPATVRYKIAAADYTSCVRDIKIVRSVSLIGIVHF